MCACFYLNSFLYYIAFKFGTTVGLKQCSTRFNFPFQNSYYRLMFKVNSYKNQLPYHCIWQISKTIYAMGFCVVILRLKIYFNFLCRKLDQPGLNVFALLSVFSRRLNKGLKSKHTRPHCLTFPQTFYVSKRHFMMAFPGK